MPSNYLDSEYNKVSPKGILSVSIIMGCLLLPSLASRMHQNDRQLQRHCNLRHLDLRLILMTIADRIKLRIAVCTYAKGFNHVSHS